MPQTALNNIGLNYDWDLGSDGWKTGMDTNMILIDALLQAGVIAVGTNTPPVSPAQGEAHIIGTSPTGAWAGNARRFAVFNAGAWTITEAREGWRVYDRQNNKFWVFDGTNWTDNVAAHVARGVKAVTADNYTLILDDAWRMLELNDGAGVALTVPANSSVAFPIGTEIQIAQVAGGPITVTPAGTVTVLSLGAADETAGQEAVATLKKVNVNTWRLYGDIV